MLQILLESIYNQPKLVLIQLKINASLKDNFITGNISLTIHS